MVNKNILILDIDIFDKNNEIFEIRDISFLKRAKSYSKNQHQNIIFLSFLDV